MSNSSPIKGGNEWRFSKDNQPSRKPTLKQQTKLLEGLLVMPLEEVKNIALSSPMRRRQRSGRLQLTKVFLPLTREYIFQASLQKQVVDMMKAMYIVNQELKL